MAERHQLKIADRHGIAEDDPFAELTRIMGFDPREPVRPQAVATQQDARGDFDIDLEKELLGEFATYDGLAQDMPARAEPAAMAEEEYPQQRMSRPAPAEDHAFLAAEMDDAVTSSLERGFSAFDDAGQDMAAADPEAPAGPEALATESEAYAGAQDEAGGYRAMADEAHAATGADTAEVAAALRGTWFGPAQDEPAAEEAAALVEDEGEAVAARSFDDGFDAAVSADLGEGFSPAVGAEPVGPIGYDAAPVHETFASEDGDGAPEDLPASYEYEEAAPYREPLDDDQPETAAYTQPEPVNAVDTDDFGAHFDIALADVDMDFDARPQPAAVSAVYDPPVQHDAFAPRASADTVAEPAPARRESSLEDELNALLAKMTTRPAVAAASAWPLATPVARRESMSAAPVPQPAAPAEVAEDEIHAALMADLHAMDLGDASPRDEEVDFDAEAFHAALADDDDGYAAPAAGTAPMSDWPAPAAYAAPPAPARHAQAPELETVEVPERVVALAEDLDIPDVPFEEEGAGNKFYDDLDSEFSDLLGKIDAASEPTHAAYDDAYGAGFGRGSRHPEPAAPAAFQQPVAPASTPAYAAAADFDVDDLPGSRPVAEHDPFAVEELAYDPDDTLAPSGAVEADAAGRAPRRGLLVAGIVCAVAVAGGLGALAMSFGGKGAGDAPALVKADNSPIKVKPENPGGTVIPNQDNKVYEAVAKGAKPSEPAQQKLVTSNEEPVDVNAAAPQSRVVDLSAQAEASAPAPAGKSEDRVEQTAQADASASDVPVVTPRKVRTMVVKPDGSLVPREDPAPAVAASEPADPAPQHVVATGDQTGAVAPANAAAGDDPVAKVASGEPALKPAKGEVRATPKTAPIAPQRPSDQPLDVVGEVKPDQVASIDNAAAAAGNWSMQIASQPTAESAQSTYQDLARRYGGVLGGHGVSIVKADIAGKGTFYRVRVPAQSRNDAIKLCESYKAAGGNCFVSK